MTKMGWQREICLHPVVKLRRAVKRKLFLIRRLVFLRCSVLGRSRKLTAMKLRQEKQRYAITSTTTIVIPDVLTPRRNNGEQLERSKEMQELRGANQWINQVGWDAASQADVFSKKTQQMISLRLDWADVKKRLADSTSCEG